MIGIFIIFIASKVIHAYYCRKGDLIIPRKENEVCTFSQHIADDCTFSHMPMRGIRNYSMPENPEEGAHCIFKNSTLTCACFDDMCNNKREQVKEIIRRRLEVSSNTLCFESDVEIKKCERLLTCFLSSTDPSVLEDQQRRLHTVESGSHQNDTVQKKKDAVAKIVVRYAYRHREESFLFISMVFLLMVGHFVLIIILIVVLYRSQEKNAPAPESSRHETTTTNPKKEIKEEDVELGRVYNRTKFSI
ncbi:hypothetical protein RB195_014758 [Necator americanus]|uniref:Uncharacterized protein n=1 Tax=Necator americanus TaxID=51031 RepID=A0ABR1E1H7_NECAM